MLHHRHRHPAVLHHLLGHRAHQRATQIAVALGAQDDGATGLALDDVEQHVGRVTRLDHAFKGDTDIKRALTAYLDNDKDYVEDEEEEPEDEDYNEDDWEN